MLCLSGFELYSRWVPMNIAYFSISADRHGLLTPEESRSKLSNSFHVLKKTSQDPVTTCVTSETI